MSKRATSKRSEFEKTLRIGVRFDGSKFVLLDGKDLPNIATGTVCELKLPPHCLTNESDRVAFCAETQVRFLEAGAPIVLGISSGRVPNLKVPGLITAQALKIQSEYIFVSVTLLEPLWLSIRGDEEAKLCPCMCGIGCLKVEATSVNHAFTLISEHFETGRLSHTGNVFLRGYTLDEKGRWRRLEDLRIAAIMNATGASAKK